MLKKLPVALAALLICVSCGDRQTAVDIPPLTPAPGSLADSAAALKQLVEADPELKQLLTGAIDEARRINPDPATNPAQTLEQYYQFVSRVEMGTPAGLLPFASGVRLLERIEQSLGYLHFIADIPLPELQGRGLPRNSLQYLDSYNAWFKGFVQGWGKRLESPSSWNSELLGLAQADKAFGLDRGWYESPDNWKSFNEFLARKLASPDQRPIAAPKDDAVFVSPVDAVPMGTWPVDKNHKLIAGEGVAIKTATLESVEALLEASSYARAFAGGTFTHLFLGVGDYHRYHFPMSGTIWEIGLIPGKQLSGGITTWDAANRRYRFDAGAAAWQWLETRGLVVLQTDRFGLVALMPIGVSAVGSVNFEKSLEAGIKVNKGDPMGHFLFGGSNFAVVFQAGVKVQLEAPRQAGGAGWQHVLMGQPLARLSGAPQ